MSGTEVFHWDDITPYGDEKADRRLIPGKAGDFKRVAVPGGTVAARHEHDFEQFFMVAQGQGVLTCAQGEIALRPGVVIHFAPHVWHEARFTADTVIYEVNFRA
ncbi:cupin domain-containing protein [Acidocella sp.]|uniref:cupin domain-containing protein n=1 Tax=Acidocella sp. TaxID=50710 RepID=UPI002632EFF0|nr:cupin domain-containing protein [Acidocella sp.]